MTTLVRLGRSARGWEHTTIEVAATSLVMSPVILVSVGRGSGTQIGRIL
jgi:hypothetical protein